MGTYTQSTTTLIKTKLDNYYVNTLQKFYQDYRCWEIKLIEQKPPKLKSEQELELIDKNKDLFAMKINKDYAEEIFDNVFNTKLGHNILFSDQKFKGIDMTVYEYMKIQYLGTLKK